jgi:hypothetical protein
METKVHDFWFKGRTAPALAASVVDGPWAKADTSAAGSPTLLTVADEMVGTLAATDEVENLCLYFGDVLSFDIDDLLKAEFWLRCTASLPAVQSLAFGMGSARNDDPDAITAHAMFRVLGSAGLTNAVTCESDDGVNDVDDIAAGQVLVATTKRFVIDFATGITTQSPGASLGRKSNVLFYMGDARGNLQRVAAGQRFDLSNYTGGLQPFVQLAKTGGVGTPAFSLRRVRITERLLA